MHINKAWHAYTDSRNLGSATTAFFYKFTGGCADGLYKLVACKSAVRKKRRARKRPWSSISATFVCVPPTSTPSAKGFFMSLHYGLLCVGIKKVDLVHIKYEVELLRNLRRAAGTYARLE